MAACSRGMRRRTRPAAAAASAAVSRGIACINKADERWHSALPWKLLMITGTKSSTDGFAEQPQASQNEPE